MVLMTKQIQEMLFFFLVVNKFIQFNIGRNHDEQWMAMVEQARTIWNFNLQQEELNLFWKADNALPHGGSKR
jgi:hypothetical protein